MEHVSPHRVQLDGRVQLGRVGRLRAQVAGLDQGGAFRPSRLPVRSPGSSSVHEVGAVRHGEHECHVLFDQQHAGAELLGDGPQHRQQAVDDDRGQAQAHLVDHQQPGSAEHRPGDREHLLLAARQEAGWRSITSLSAGNHSSSCSMGSGFRRPASAGPSQSQVLGSGQVEEEAPVLGDVGDTPTSDLDHVGRVAPDDAGAAPLRPPRHGRPAAAGAPTWSTGWSSCRRRSPPAVRPPRRRRRAGRCRARPGVPS